MAFIDYYKILGVDKNIPQKDVREAYRKRAKQFHPDLLELKGTGTFQQNGLIVELREGEMRQKITHIGVEIPLHLELVGLSRNALANANQHVNPFVFKQLTYFGVQIHLIATTLEDVRHNHHFTLVLVLLFHHIQGDR